MCGQFNTVERFRLSWNDVLTSFIDRLAEDANCDYPLFKVFGLDDAAACARAGISIRLSTDVLSARKSQTEELTCRATLGLQVGQLLCARM